MNKEKRHFSEEEKQLSQELLFKSLKLLSLFILLVVIAVVSFMLYDAFGHSMLKSINKNKLTQEQIEARMIAVDQDDDRVENGIHIATGLVYTDDFDLIRGMCTSCHSAKLITQNRATKEGWTEMIRWMQETQGLWDLGSNEKIIVDYLAEHYAPDDIGRRANLEIEEIEWYKLE